MKVDFQVVGDSYNCNTVKIKREKFDHVEK